MICAHCAADARAKRDGTLRPLTKTGQIRLPMGWLRAADAVLCRSCKDERYMMRQISVPIAAHEGMWDWVSACWSTSTTLANWYIVELAKQDEAITSRPKAQTDKMPDMPQPAYLYREARSRVPEMDPQSVVCVLQAVERRYRKTRFDRWIGRRSLDTYRYPAPYPIHEQAWSLGMSDEGRFVVEARVGGERRELPLRIDWRQREQLTAILEGRAVRRAATIYRRTATVDGRQRHQVMLGIAAYLPRLAQTKGTDRMLRVFTGVDALLTVTGGAGEWRVVFDDVPGRIAGHRRFLARKSEDLKPEKRWPKSARKQMLQDVHVRVTRQRHRLDSLIHLAAVEVANYARRQRATRVEYDDSVRSWAESFPWHLLGQRLREKVEARGIAFERSGDAARPDAARTEADA